MKKGHLIAIGGTVVGCSKMWIWFRPLSDNQISLYSMITKIGVSLFSITDLKLIHPVQIVFCLFWDMNTTVTTTGERKICNVQWQYYLRFCHHNEYSPPNKREKQEKNKDEVDQKRWKVTRNKIKARKIIQTAKRRYGRQKKGKKNGRNKRAKNDTKIMRKVPKKRCEKNKARKEKKLRWEYKKEVEKKGEKKEEDQT